MIQYLSYNSMLIMLSIMICEFQLNYEMDIVLQQKKNLERGKHDAITVIRTIFL